MPKPSFEVTIEDGLFKCTLTLPRNAAFQSIVGPLSSSSNLSKQLVSLEACKKLHQLGELNDHLVPLTEEPMDTDFTTADEKCISGPGMSVMLQFCLYYISWIHPSLHIFFYAVALVYFINYTIVQYYGSSEQIWVAIQH
jgi:hypothetical protein